MSNELNFNDASCVPMITLGSAYNLIEEYLKPSHGLPMMSPQDTKLTVLALKHTLEQQIRVNMDLIARLEKLEEGQKSLRRRLFNR